MVNHEDKGWTTESTHRLIQYSVHAVDDELKILWSMKPAKIVSIIIPGRCPTPIFRNWIDKDHQEELKAIDDKDLLGILPHYMVVGDSPDRWIVFDGLAIG